jgi:transposase-like protein
VKKCPRCHSSMLLDYGAAVEGWQRMWKCLGCGREILFDPVRRAEDAQLQDKIRRSEVRS